MVNFVSSEFALKYNRALAYVQTFVTHLWPAHDNRSFACVLHVPLLNITNLKNLTLLRLPVFSFL